MSLTSLLKIPIIHKEFMSKIAIPKVDKKWETLVPRKTGDPAKLGTSVDYAIRFWLQKKHGGIQVNPLVAELALTRDIPEFTFNKKSEARKIVKQALEHIEQAKALDDSFCYWCFQLANLDLIYRQQIMPKSIPMIPSKSDIRELKDLVALAIKNWPIPRSYCLLNPTFGNASQMVGGADADVIQDSTIIDIKCVAEPSISDVVTQLIGYTSLYSAGSIDGLPIGEGIDKIGVYYVRHGKCLSWDIEEICSWQEVKGLYLFLETMVKQGTAIDGNRGLGADNGTMQYLEENYQLVDEGDN
jgi:hypothetical protein